MDMTEKLWILLLGVAGFFFGWQLGSLIVLALK